MSLTSETIKASLLKIATIVMRERERERTREIARARERLIGGDYRVENFNLFSYFYEFWVLHHT